MKSMWHRVGTVTVSFLLHIVLLKLMLEECKDYPPSSPNLVNGCLKLKMPILAFVNLFFFWAII